MGKKRDKANENIVFLIDELVDTKFSALGCNCPYSYEKVRPCSSIQLSKLRFEEER